MKSRINIYRVVYVEMRFMMIQMNTIEREFSKNYCGQFGSRCGAMASNGLAYGGLWDSVNCAWW